MKIHGGNKQTEKLAIITVQSKKQIIYTRE